MWGWFGGSGAQKRRDAPKDAILGLRQQLDMLQKRERHLENQMAEQDALARKNVTVNKTAAKAALRRKKQHEHSLEQTTAQISTIEQQIYSIEAANINQETLLAMQKAGQAMKKIHGGLTMDKIDQTMEELREQHALGQEIGEAITSVPIGEPVDEQDLEAELEGMEQEQIDERMLKGGVVPVSDEVHRLPTAANGARKFKPFRPLRGSNLPNTIAISVLTVKGKATKVQPEEEDEEAELAKLQAEMAM